MNSGTLARKPRLQDGFEASCEQLDAILKAVQISTQAWLQVSASHDAAIRAQTLHLVLARSATGRRLRRSKQVAQRIAALLLDDSITVRRAAVLALWEVRTATAVPCLAAMLEIEDRRTKIWCSMALGRQGGEDAVACLKAALRTESDPELLEWYARALGECRQASAAPDLVRLAKHTDWRVRWGVAQGLDRLGHPAAIEIISALASDPGLPLELRRHVVTWRRRVKRKIGKLANMGRAPSFSAQPVSPCRGRQAEEPIGEMLPSGTAP